jgi:hypothetical protein
MSKIRVLVNGVLNSVGSATARNVLAKGNMCLVPVSITDYNGNYRKFPINQTIVNLITPQEVSEKCVSDTLFNYGRPDVVVDCNPDSILKLIIPDCLRDKTSFIFSFANNVEQEIIKLKKEIKGFGINIALLPENSSEQEILRAINFLYEKNEASIFGKVFCLEDIAA